jgi:hypothetical protein
MKKLLLTAACLLLLAPIAANAATKTKLILDYSGMGDSWVVEVKSKRKACKDDRKVTVFHKTDPGKEKVGSANAAPADDIYLAIISDPDPAVGNHIAKAKATNRCKGAKSNIVTIAG